MIVNCLPFRLFFLWFQKNAYVLFPTKYRFGLDDHCNFPPKNKVTGRAFMPNQKQNGQHFSPRRGTFLVTCVVFFVSASKRFPVRGETWGCFIVIMIPSRERSHIPPKRENPEKSSTQKCPAWEGICQGNPSCPPQSYPPRGIRGYIIRPY